MKPIIDDPCHLDQLGRQVAVDALLMLIASIDDNSNSSFTIGVFGDWGTGKTSMLRQLEAKLDSSEHEAPLVVWFNPWQFSKQDNILASLFMSISGAIEAEIEMQRGILGKSAKSVKRFASRLKDFAGAFVARGELEVSVPLLASIKYSGASANEAGGKQPHNAPIEDLRQTYASLYFDVLSGMSNAAESLDNKVVVLIDDLDRCEHETIIALLDGIKVFFDLPNFVFVIGAARDAVKTALRRKEIALGSHNDTVDELAYLDKIIQFGYVIPPPDVGLLKSSIILPILNEYRVDQNYADLVVDIIGINPRSIKRMLNHFIFSQYILKNTIDGNVNAGLVLKASLLSYRHPRIFSAIQRNHQTIIEFERRIETSEQSSPAQVITTDNKAVDELISQTSALNIFKVLNFRIAEDSFKGLPNAEAYMFASSIGDLSELSGITSGDAVDPDEMSSPMDGFVDRFEKISALKVRIGNDKYGSFHHKMTDTLYVDKFPMTEEIFAAIVQEYEIAPRPGFPITNVSWVDAVDFCNRLSNRYGLDTVYSNLEGKVEIDYSKNGFRLLTESEWESIAGSGLTSDFNVDDDAWYVSNAAGGVRPTGAKPANEHGMYDMLGNVWEWVNDWQGAYPEGEQVDWGGQKTGFQKVCRGGSWANFAKSITPDYREAFDLSHRDDNVGFRICTRSNIGAL